MPDLNFVTSRELIDELRSRYDACVIVVVRENQDAVVCTKGKSELINECICAFNYVTGDGQPKERFDPPEDTDDVL